MTVNELIKYLQVYAATVGNKQVMARDDHGKLSTYPILWNGDDYFIINALPEPDTRFYEHPFDGPDDDRYCPGPCNGDFNE
jgi:hypothetical protein